MYVVLPLWLAAGFADYICHRASHIERTSGWKESMLHLVQFGEMAVPVLAALLRNQLGRDPDHDCIPDSPSGDRHLGCAIRLGDARGFPNRAARPQRARNAALYRTAVGYCRAACRRNRRYALSSAATSTWCSSALQGRRRLSGRRTRLAAQAPEDQRKRLAAARGFCGHSRG